MCEMSVSYHAISPQNPYFNIFNPPDNFLIDFWSNQWLSINIDFQSNVSTEIWMNQLNLLVWGECQAQWWTVVCLPLIPHKGEKGNPKVGASPKTQEAWKTMSTISRFRFVGTPTWKGIPHASPCEHNASFMQADQHSPNTTLPLLYDKTAHISWLWMLCYVMSTWRMSICGVQRFWYDIPAPRLGSISCHATPHFKSVVAPSFMVQTVWNLKSLGAYVYSSYLHL